jgi:Putative beta-barrel porin 2
MRLREVVEHRGRWTVTSAVIASLAGLFATAPAHAQVGSIGGVNAPSFQPPPVATDHPDFLSNPGQTDDALVAGNWLVYPSAFVGGIYDSNINQSATNVQSSGGARLTPSLLAVTVGDFSKTTIYGLADARIYANQQANNSDTVDVSSGVIEIYQPLPDLIFTGQGDYTRQKDLFSTLGDTHSVMNLNPVAVGLAPIANPVPYNQLTGSLSVQKNFSTAFLIASGSVVGQIYDQNTNLGQNPNNTTFTGSLRGGIWITPAIYSYVEGSGDSRNESISGLSSSGYRVAGGFGTDQIGLVRGEVYGGYQSESYSASGIGTVSSGLYGARGYYYPLPDLTVNVAVDEELGVSLLTPLANSPFGSATKATTALATANYNLTDLWAAGLRGGYIHTDYIGTARRDDAWTGGGTLTYQIVRNIGLTADYQHTELSSNVALQSFSRDVVTFGLTFKY